MQCGIDLVALRPSLLGDLGRVGVVSHQACATLDGRPSTDAVFAACREAKGSRVTAVFGPQHGYRQCEQDNMVETPDERYTFHGSGQAAVGDTTADVSVPLYSLYSERREPSPEQMEQVDTLVVDLPDIGCRIYTFMLTLATCLRAANRSGKRVVVLDRPNPLGLSWQGKADGKWRRVEGNILDTKWHSFVGWYPIPLRHGLTLGELGNLFVRMDYLKQVVYSVVKVEGLRRKDSMRTMLRTGYASSFPFASPNMPTWNSALYFPAFVVLEATNVSEGRGTTIPFQLVGAPYLDAQGCIGHLRERQARNRASAHASFNGVAMAEHHFRTTFNKHAGNISRGVRFSPTFQLPFFSRRDYSDGGEEDEEDANVFALGMHFLHYVVSRHVDAFKWRDPKQGYEYNFEDPPLLLILGHERWWNLFEGLRTGPKKSEDGESERELDACLQWAYDEAQRFAAESTHAHLYP